MRGLYVGVEQVYVNCIRVSVEMGTTVYLLCP